VLFSKNFLLLLLFLAALVNNNPYNSTRDGSQLMWGWRFRATASADSNQFARLDFVNSRKGDMAHVQGWDRNRLQLAVQLVDYLDGFLKDVTSYDCFPDVDVEMIMKLPEFEAFCRRSELLTAAATKDIEILLSIIVFINSELFKVLVELPPSSYYLRGSFGSLIRSYKVSSVFSTT